MPSFDQLSFMASLGFASWEPGKILEELSRIGYKGVGWTLAHFNPRQKSPEALENLIKETHNYEMEVGEIVVQQDFVSLDENVRRDRINLTKESIQAAGEAGAKVINVFTGPAPWDPKAPRIPRDLSQGEAWDIVLDAFEEILKVAEKYKVYIAVEGVFGHLCHDYYTTKPLIDHFDSEYLGINMDPSHGSLYGNDIPWVVKQWSDKIKHVHLKDAIGVPGENGRDFMFPLLGEGMIDWSAFFNALDEIGYKGFLSVEFESFKYYRVILEGDPVRAAELSMEQLKKLLK